MNRELDFHDTVMEALPGKAEVAGSMRETLTNLAVDRWRIAVALVLGLLVTAAAWWTAPVTYVSEASLLLRLGREYMYTPEVGESQNAAPMAFDRDQTLVAEARILNSRDLHEAVIDKLGAARVYPALAANQPDPGRQRAAAVLALGRSVESELLKGSNLLQVSFKHVDPVMAATVLNQLVEGYISKRLTLFNRTSANTTAADFEARRTALARAEAELVEFKAKHGIRAFAEEMSLLLSQRSVLDQRLTDNRLSLAQAGGRSQALSGGMATLAGEVTLSTETQRSEAVDHARKLLLDLRLKERDLSAKFSDSNLSVQDVRADIARTNDFLREYESQPQRSVRSGRSPALDAAEADLVRTRADQRQASAGASTLVAQRVIIDQRLALLAGSENELRALERERRLAEVNYEAAAKRQRDEQALEALDRQRSSSVSLLQAPRVPLEPKSMRTAILVAGLVGSLVLAIAVAVVSGLLRDTFLTPEQLQRAVDVPVLAVIPVDRLR